MLDGMITEIFEELTERLRAVQGMTVDQLLNLQKRLGFGYVTCYTHLTKRNKLVQLLSRQQVGIG